MTHTSLEAVNSLTSQSNVVPQKGAGAVVEDGVLKLSLKPHSYTMIRLKAR
jgi:alpha-L-arabinofuranosidase